MMEFFNRIIFRKIIQWRKYVVIIPSALACRSQHNIFTWEMHTAGRFFRQRNKNPLITRGHACKYKNAAVPFSLIRPGILVCRRSWSQLCGHDLHFWFHQFALLTYLLSVKREKRKKGQRGGGGILSFALLPRCQDRGVFRAWWRKKIWGMTNRNSNAVFICEYLVRLIAIVRSNSSRSEIMEGDNRTGVRTWRFWR